MTIRPFERLIVGQQTTDGGGVRLRRSLGQTQVARLDPFLMLDEFRSSDANDYIAGFPPHPHRGFETVTYMLAGRMRHEDHLGNKGVIEGGGVQWMTAASGIIHSEMPEQESGLMHGFQLWLNLPADEKMKPADWRDIPPSEIPQLELEKASVKVIAGEYEGRKGAVSGVSTQPLYLDVRMQPDATFALDLSDARNACVYVFDGTVKNAAVSGHPNVDTGTLGIFGKGEKLQVAAGSEGAAFLLLAGKPLNEPVVQYGPFVMNTRDEVEQAMRDYSAGRLGR